MVTLKLELEPNVSNFWGLRTIAVTSWPLSSACLVN